MHQEAPQQADQPGTDDPRTGVPRRRMLWSTGGIMLLAAGGVASLEKSGAPATTLSTGHARSGAILDPTTSPASTDGASGGAAPLGTTALGTATASPPGSVDGTALQARVASVPQYYVDDAGPTAIALTLDDGPHPVYTPQVLAILDRYGVQATFNMIGRQIRSNLGLVREVAASGHTITNHTWDHADMRRYPTSRVLSEIDRCNDALSDAGQQPSIFRAPFGYWTRPVFEACAARRLTPLGWSVDPQDWDTAHVTAWDIVRTVMRTTRRHDIILEHDGGGNRSNTVAALQIFIPELLARGFVFTAV